MHTYIFTCIYIYTLRIFIGYRRCRRPLKKLAGDDFWRPWLTWGAPCKAFMAFGMHWARQGSQSRLVGTPVQVGAPISRPGWGGGGLEV